MEITPLEIPDVKLIRPKRFGDRRGFFMETFNAAQLSEHGIECAFVQDNQSRSEHTGVVRGLHFQAPPVAQDKLIRVIRGRIFDVAVDIRVGSPTYGKWVSAELSEDNDKQLFVPAGFAHGFVTMEPMTEVVYKVSDVYAPETEGGIIWNDAELSIPWPLKAEPRLSDKDKVLPTFAQFESPFVFDEAAVL